MLCASISSLSPWVGFAGAIIWVAAGEHVACRCPGDERGCGTTSHAPLRAVSRWCGAGRALHARGGRWAPARQTRARQNRCPPRRCSVWLTWRSGPRRGGHSLERAGWRGGWRQLRSVQRSSMPTNWLRTASRVQAVERSRFAETEDVVGLYVDPPAHAVVLSVDEKSQIQALDRTQPGCR